MKRTESKVAMIKAATLALLFFGGLARPGSAAERELRGSLGLQANPLGLRAEVEANWKWSLSRSTHPLVKGAHVSVGISDQISPASNQTQVWLQVSPLAILDIRAGATGVAYFGTFGNTALSSSGNGVSGGGIRWYRWRCSSTSKSRIAAGSGASFR
jgi:hypothetical protein